MSAINAVRGRFGPENKLVVRSVQIGLFILGWQLLAGIFPQELMPTFFQTVAVMVELVRSGQALEHLVATFTRVLWAFLISVCAGVMIGIAMGSQEYLNKLLTPYVMIALALPGIIWASMIVTARGFGNVSAILIAVLIVTPFTALDVWKGTENIDVNLIRMARSFNVSRGRTFVRILLPSVAPEIFATLRIGLALSYKVVIVAELFATSNGVGQELFTAYDAYRFQEAWAWGLLFILIVIVIEFGIFRKLEERVFQYREDNSLAQVTHG